MESDYHHPKLKWMGRGLIRTCDQYYCQVLSYGQSYTCIQVNWYQQPLTQGPGNHKPNSYLVVLVLSNTKILPTF